MKKYVWLVAIGFCFTRAGEAQHTLKRDNDLAGLRFIGSYEVPHNLSFRGTTVGGLSGIDYDKEKQQYYLICDDRSAINPARFYTAKIRFSQKKIDTVYFTAVTTLQQQNGKPYPDSKKDPAHTPDPEALRYDPQTGNMLWTSEGERILKKGDTVLENPAITLIRPDGKYLDTFHLPANLRMQAAEKGPRQNGVLEGMSFADNYQTLYVNVEEPLYEDGPRADLTENGAYIRIYKFGKNSRRNTAQYAYKLEPVAYPAITAAAFKINGVPDILDAGGNRLIVLERSFSTGRMPCTIRIFLADLNGVENIKNNPSLKRKPAVKPVKKKLLLNMDSLGIYVDNVEGVTFGPNLPNGHKTLVLVTDNNFLALEKTQFFVFECMPVPGNKK